MRHRQLTWLGGQYGEESNETEGEGETRCEEEGSCEAEGRKEEVTRSADAPSHRRPYGQPGDIMRDTAMRSVVTPGSATEGVGETEA